MSAAPLIVGFCGLLRHGKTTAALFLVADYPGFHRISFADPIRRMLLALGLTARDLAEGKEIPHPLLGGKTPREAMQSLGTEWGRDRIDGELWLRVAEHQARQLLASGCNVVFDDVRFANEAAMIRRLGGIVVKVVNTAAAPSPHAAHSSEAGIAPDLIDHTLSAADVGALRTRLHALFNAVAS